MNRRHFLACAGALTLGAWPARGQERAIRFADMHSHAGVGRRIDNMRALMAENGMLIVARAVACWALLERDAPYALPPASTGTKRKPGELNRWEASPCARTLGPRSPFWGF